jgi:hypothetical protein
VSYASFFIKICININKTPTYSRKNLCKHKGESYANFQRKLCYESFTKELLRKIAEEHGTMLASAKEEIGIEF